MQDLLYHLGATHKFKGFRVILMATNMVYHNPEKYMYFRTKVLYPEIARLIGSQPKSVEANMMNLSILIWQKSPDELSAIARRKLTTHPSAAELIDILIHAWDTQDTRAAN